MPRSALSIIVVAVVSVGLLASFASIRARQEPVGRDTPPAFSAINERLRHYVDNHEIAGAVTLVGTRDRIVHLGTIGQADIGRDAPMQSDTIFWIASMTKPITATAVLMLQDEVQAFGR